MLKAKKVLKRIIESGINQLDEVEFRYKIDKTKNIIYLFYSRFESDVARDVMIDFKENNRYYDVGSIYTTLVGNELGYELRFKDATHLNNSLPLVFKGLKEAGAYLSAIR